MRKVFLGLIILQSLIFSAPLHAAPILTLTPSGDIFGLPGKTIGWGFSLTNDTPDYLVVNSADYLTWAPVGTFTDFISQYFEIVSPGATCKQLFNITQQKGIGLYIVYDSAPLGAFSMGQIQIGYDLYTLSPLDPIFDPSTAISSTGNVLFADASVSVSATGPESAETSVVPEPSTFSLLAAGMFVFFGGALRRMRAKCF